MKFAFLLYRGICRFCAIFGRWTGRAELSRVSSLTCRLLPGMATMVTVSVMRIPLLDLADVADILDLVRTRSCETARCPC